MNFDRGSFICYSCAIRFPRTEDYTRCPLCGLHATPDSHEPEVTEEEVNEVLRAKELRDKRRAFDDYYREHVRADLEQAIEELTKPDCDPYELLGLTA
jgi:hypothetical protein